MEAAKQLLRRARLDQGDLTPQTRADLYEVAARLFPEGSKEEKAALHNAFLIRESLRNQLAFSELLDR